jgi:hypothetical protein
MGAELISARLMVSILVVASSMGARAQESAPVSGVSSSYLASGVALLSSASGRLGAFLDEQTQQTKLNVYGCLIGASGPICGGGARTDHILLHQAPGAVGLGGDLQVMDRIRVAGDLVWRPYMSSLAHDSSWTMHNMSGVREAGAGGAGFRTEWVLSYDFTNALSAGLGGSYSLSSPEAVDASYGALSLPKADQRSFGAFFHLNYRFGQNPSVTGR